MARAPWLADVLRDAGCDVAEVAGWLGRGREMKVIYGAVGHDTVTTRDWTDDDVVALLRDGRRGLSGPLSQLGLNRDGLYYVIADGRANHNGYGVWGNDSIGIEAFAAGGLSGREERWNSTQEDAFVVGARAILEYLDLPPSDYWNPRAAGHKETDPDRKQDPWEVDMPSVRARIGSGSTARVQRDEPEDGEEDDMAKVDVVKADGDVWLIDHPYRLLVPEKDEDYYLNLAASDSNTQYDGPHEWDEERIAKHPMKPWGVDT